MACGKIKHIKTTVDDITFDSKMESEYYLYLKALKKKGIVTNIELQPEYILQEKYVRFEGKVIYGSDKEFESIKKKNKLTTVRAIKYIADFKATYKDGHVEIVDTKGKSTVEFEIKKKLFMAKFPEIDFKVLIKDKKLDEWVDYYEYKKRRRSR